MSSDIHDLVLRRLRAAKQRYTHGRRALVELLADAGGPMTIPQILDADGEMAQSSAYRNLAVLEQAEVVHRIVTADDFAHYELAEDLSGHHHHLICTSCGSVADFTLTAAVESELDSVLARVARRADFTMESHRLDLVGTCDDCR